jgi:hypothetical protein
VQKRRAPIVVAFLIAAVALSLCAAAQTPSRLPASLSDREFWQLVGDLSEPDGFFEDENYVSNELGYERTMRRLQEAVTPDGVFLGVGPEQNFSYVAALRPRMAFVLDIRRQNLIEHLMYKALFELSDDRVEFVSRLFSRRRPAGLDADVGVDALFQAYGAVSPDRQLFDDTLARMLNVLVDRHGFALTDADRASLLKVFDAFYKSGLELMYVFRGTPERHPTYQQMMTAADETGRRWSYLASAESFQHVRGMQQKNLIVPVVGDFAGPKALKAIGAYVRERRGVISVFYVSNVEPYLFANGTWKRFYETLDTLPLDTSGLFVRTFFGATGRECRAMGPTIRIPVLGSMETLMSAWRAGKLTSQCDLVAFSKR